MWRSLEPDVDVASAIIQGGRDYQEDAIITDFPLGTGFGVIVLADGMGGHAAGDVASNIVVTEVFSELKFQNNNFVNSEPEIPDHLRAAADSANECVRAEATSNPKTRGMGATLVSVVIIENRLYWLSIGDSPMYLIRKGKIRQLNDDHSMAPQIKFMVESGLIDAETGKYHPDRNCLTSVIMGEKVAKIDCPEKPFELLIDDIVLVSSDGLQYLDDEIIQKIIVKNRKRRSSEIAGLLLDAIEKLADPDQDNVSFSLIKLNKITAVRRNPPPVTVSDEEHVATAVTRVANSNETLNIPEKKLASDQNR